MKEEYFHLEIQDSLSRALISINRKEKVDEIDPSEYSMTWFGEEVIIQDVEVDDYKIGIDSTTGRSYLINMNDDESIEICKERIKESKIYKELENRKCS